MTVGPNRVIDEYPRETRDFVPFVGLAVNGAPPDPDDVDYAVCPQYARPLAWSAALVDTDGNPGFMLDGPSLGRGVFKVFARVTSSPGPVVIELGWFRLT